MSADYTVIFTTYTTLTEGSYLEITLPSEVSVDGVVTCTPWVCAGTSTIRVDMFTPGAQVPGVYSVTVSGLTNAPTAGATGQFILATKTSDGYAVDEFSGAHVTFT